MKIAQPQTKRTIAVSILLSAAASAVTGFAAQRAVFIAVTLVLAAVNILYIADSVMRYKKISRYNDMLGKVLYSDEKINFEEYKEGELSILNSEIQKLIRKLRDDARLLKKQKNQLADSMADISHQIKTPLTSANIVVDLLSAESISDERRIALLNQLQMLLDRIVWQIDGMLKLSKLDAGMISFKSEHFSADELVKKAVEPILIPLELRNVAVNVKSGENVGLSGDLNWCAEAVENIVKNCMEHCEDSGQIDIICDENPLYTQIIVRDNGCGIAKNDLQHIFERFYQGENCSENNYGIGLALAKMIIERQNGTIKVQNRTDVRGAEFTVRFYKGAV